MQMPSIFLKKINPSCSIMERDLKYIDRIGWCRTNLKKAVLVVSPTRGQLVLSDLGKA